MTDQEVQESIDKEIAAWKKRLRRKGPFYLLRTEPYHYEVTRQDGSQLVEDGTSYCVIWNDGHKTKIGWLRDYMLTRYGISTCSVLNGDRPHDLWNGSDIDDDTFAEMLAVRNEVSALPHFDFDQLQHVRT